MGEEFRQFWFHGLVPNMWTPISEDSLPSSWSLFPKKSETPSKKFLSNLIQEKQKYIQKVVTQIQIERGILQFNVHKISREFQDVVSILNGVTEQEEQGLKTRLQRAIEMKEEKWESQLNICKKAVTWLQNLKDEHPNSLMDIEAFNNICHNMFIKNIEVTEKGELQLDKEDLTVFKVLQNLGRVGEVPFANPYLKDKIPLMPKFILGGRDERDVQLCRPWGVCSDVEGRILVCDRSNDRVVVFNNFGKFLFEFGKTGSGPGEFSRPAGITVDKHKQIIVCDKDNHRIQVFDFYGIYLFEFGQFGSEKGQFHYPWDVAVNCYGNIAVTDSKNHRVQLFDNRGIFLNEYKAKGFDLPRSLAFKPDGRLMITDFNNHRIVVLNKNFKKVKTYCREGSANGRLFRPQGITCLKNDYFAVSDSKNFRIQVFDDNGNFVTSFGVEGTEPGQFNCPQGIAYHPNGNLIVADLNNSRIQIFPDALLYDNSTKF